MASSVSRYIVIPLALMSAPPVMAAGGLGLTAKIGTLGYGLEATTSFTETINARLGYQAFTYSTDIDFDTDVGTSQMDADLDMSNVSLLLDWHAFNGGFRFSGGILSNDNKLTGTAPEDNYNIGDGNYSVGLDTRVEFENSPAPYLGIGWGNAVGKDQRWVFSADLGVMFQGAANVNLDVTGSGAGLVPQSDIDKEEKRIEDDLKNFQYYPVASVGISYHF